MSDNCETTCSLHKGPLEEIEGDEIVGVEVIGGGHKYCNIIEMKLKSGKFLVIERDLDISRYGITPRISYKIGKWCKIYPNKTGTGDYKIGKLFKVDTDKQENSNA